MGRYAAVTGAATRPWHGREAPHSRATTGTRYARGNIGQAVLVPDVIFLAVGK